MLHRNWADSIIISLAPLEHHQELLVDLLYGDTVNVLSVVRLYNQQTTLHQIQEVMDELGAFRMRMEFADELDLRQHFLSNLGLGGVSLLVVPLV